MTKQAINRHLARADALGDTTLDKITGTSLDTGVEMDALAKLPEPERDRLSPKLEYFMPQGSNNVSGSQAAYLEYPVLPDTVEGCDAAHLRLSIAERKVWAAHEPLYGSDGELLLRKLPKKTHQDDFTEAERLAALPRLRERLLANPHDAMVMEHFGDQYLMDWMVVWGSRYEPEDHTPGAENFDQI